MEAFLLRLVGEGVEGMVVAGEELVILGTGEWEGGLVSTGGWISTALLTAPGMGSRYGVVEYWTGAV